MSIPACRLTVDSTRREVNTRVNSRSWNLNWHETWDEGCRASSFSFSVVVIRVRTGREPCGRRELAGAPSSVVRRNQHGQVVRCLRSRTPDAQRMAAAAPGVAAFQQVYGAKHHPVRL